MSNITPQSTTAELAAKVPKEPPNPGPDSSSNLPGSFPETPANELPSFSVNPLLATAGVGNPVNLQAGEKVPDSSTLTPNTISSTIRDDPDLVEASKDSHGKGKNSEQSVSINPIPATSGVGNPIQLKAGQKVPDPTTLTSNTISSTIRDDPDLAEAARDSEKSFSVKPLPATSGIGNPVQLKSGDTLPDPTSYTQNTIQSNVTLDKGSYDQNPSVYQLPDVVTPQQERDAAGRGIFNMPPVAGVMIPESSLPIGSGPYLEQDPGVTIQSAAPKSSTAALAGQVPLEPRTVPRGSEEPDATIQSAGPGSTTADLAGKTPLEPKNKSKGSEPPDVTIQSVGPNSTTARLAGQVPLEPRSVPRSSGVPDVTIQSAGPNSTTADLAGKVPLEPNNETKASEAPDVTIQSVGPNSTSANLAGQVPLEPHVPHVVEESQRKAGFPPEASANSEAVREKSEVEEELESKVPEEPAAAEGTGSSKKAKDVTIQSAGPNSSTAALAGQVPLEPKSQSKASSGEAPDSTIQSVRPHSTTAGLAGQAPLVVRSSQQEAGVSPEASANPEAVSEKAAVEKKPENKLPKEAPASEGIGSAGSSDDVTIQSVGPNSTTAALAGQVSHEHRHVPEVVQNSQHEAGFPPEASANSEAINEKAAVEKELESKISEKAATSEGRGGQITEGTRALGSTDQPEAETTPSPSHALPSSIQQSIDEINAGAGIATVAPIAPTVPHIVQESIAEANVSPEAAASKIEVDEKYQVEQQLLKEVKAEDALGEPAPSASAALIDHAPATTQRSPATAETRPTDRSHSGGHDSRDVSPMSQPINPAVTQPTLTTGVASSAVPETSAPPSTPRQEPVASSSSSKSPSTPTDKKSKRASGFFGRLKNKFHHSDKK